MKFLQEPLEISPRPNLRRGCFCTETRCISVTFFAVRGKSLFIFEPHPEVGEHDAQEATCGSLAYVSRGGALLTKVPGFVLGTREDDATELLSDTLSVAAECPKACGTKVV